MSSNYAIHRGPEFANGNHLTARKVNANLDDESSALAEKYLDAHSVKHMLSEFVKNSDFFRLLYEVFEHHMSLIRSRSQAWGDGQITIYDKALLELADKSAETCCMGAIQLFLDQVMGMEGAEAADLEALVIKHVAVRSLLLNVTHTDGQEAADPIPAILKKGAIHGSAPGQTHKDKNGPRNNAKELKTIKDSLSRILSTFSNAQREYKVIPDSDVVAKSRAAKFLRDTAENALNYLHARKMKHDMVPTLEAAFQMAKEKAIALSGGRKRPFEVNEADCKRGGGKLASSMSSSASRFARSRFQPHCYRVSRPRGDCYRPY
ncbi:hypothetical protein ACJ73_06948 [Blastomyces percursus]|uniref:Uncharacterized protein n=1 Tax=Blastomyces percursus TaxID=1658174 RepID=A0A1J9PZD4_9EURO|nr:hypothetical protein ACJ73_06948 [Blastomyces percursus]